MPSGVRPAASPGMRARVVRSRPRIRSTSSSITIRTAAGAAGTSSAMRRGCRRRRPGRRQVAELPPMTVVVTEHRTHRLRCPCCKRRTAAGFPADGRRLGVRAPAAAAIVTLTARNRISRRDMSELARELFGIRLVGRGCRRDLPTRAIALAEPHEALVASVLRSPAVNVDETGWTPPGRGRTLWTATTPEAAIFRVAEDRHRDRLQELLGKRVRRHLLLRPLVGLQPPRPRKPPSLLEPHPARLPLPRRRTPDPEAFGEQGLELTSRLFQTWHGYWRAPGPRPARKRDGAHPNRTARARRGSRTEDARRTSTTAASRTTS